ncbi:MAG: FAD-dependent oxidoreductase, partial [Marmoricola sp.]
MTLRNGSISHWMTQAASGTTGVAETSGGPPEGRHFDLLVVGGGFTGLWTAYYARQLDPALSVAVLEAEQVGYGASGRNGGWLSALIPGNRLVYERNAPGGIESVRAFQRELFGTVDEVLRVCADEGIDADQHRGGNLVVATTPAGLTRLHSRREADLRFGHADRDVVLLDQGAVRRRVDVAPARGGLFYPEVARIDPAKLVTGLADVLRRAGVQIFEGTRVTQISAGRATTAVGVVTADKVVCATEGYSGPLLGHRTVIPINSSMIVTEPLPDSHWDRIGWRDGECVSDSAHTFVYSQRTADGRIAIGGRGKPYRFRSGTGGRGETHRRTVEELRGRLEQFFPGLDFPVAHAWSGVLGVTRDWCAGVSWDAAAGVGSISGYAGHGVTATNLAARTIVDRAFERRTPLLDL